MTQLAFDLEPRTVSPGACLCGNDLPKRPAYRKPSEHCSYWCYQVSLGTYTLEQIAHMIPNRRTR